jgi:TolA-binding protein
MADAHYWLGMANLNLGLIPDAAKAFEEYLKVAPTGQHAETVKGILKTIK